jgi:hypothetical protein
LLHAVPAIARRTVHSIARQAVHGRPINARTAVQTLANQTRRVLGHPGHRMRALRRSHWMDRSFHRTGAPGAVRPHGTGGPAYAPTQYRGQFPGATAPRPYYAGGATGVGPSVGAPGVGVCPPCPRCNGGAVPAPAYCRCCGQLLR